MIYGIPPYLSLKSQKKKLAQNSLKNYETLLEFSLGSVWKNKGSVRKTTLVIHFKEGEQ